MTKQTARMTTGPGSWVSCPESVPAPAVSPPPIADLDPEPTPALATPETTQHQADPALDFLDLEPEPTKVVAAPDQAAAQGLVFAKTTLDDLAAATLEKPVPVLGAPVQEMEWVGMQLHACLVFALSRLT